MKHAASPAHPIPVFKYTTRPMELLSSPAPTISLPIQTPILSLLIVLLMAIAAPGIVAAAAQEYGPESDGCYYLAEGGLWTQRRCPQSDGSDYFYAGSGGEWVFAWECAATSLFTACLSASGEYIETYPDGSTYMETENRIYLIRHTDGTVAEAGSYDSTGTQRVYRGASTMKNSAAMRNRSLMYWYYHNMAVNTVVQSNPSAFAGLITMNTASNDYANCLHLNDSSTDFDNDGRTGFNELAEACTRDAYE